MQQQSKTMRTLLPVQFAPYVKAIRHLKNFLQKKKSEHLFVRDLTPTRAVEF